MNNLVKGLFLFCVFLTTTNRSFSEEEKIFQVHTPLAEENHEKAEVSLEILPESKESIESSSITDTEENTHNFEQQTKPLRSIFLGIYKNYKSTYLGNKTLTEYKQTLRESMKNKLQQQQQQQEQQQENNLEHETEDNDDDGVVTEYSATTEVTPLETTTLTVKQESKPNRKRKIPENTIKTPNSKVHQYNVGPALNLSLDLSNSIVKVNLDGESLREMVTGRWLNDNTEEGRGKKYEMVTRILPLFILPFLIQSAIVPFLVTKLKLLLMKSMLVGKLAIFLLIISAFRNSNKQMQTYEVAPSYWAGEPSRRSELAAAAASNLAYNGYRVEGKPAAWIN